MSDNVLLIGQGAIRATDSNSLLRLYDSAQAIFNNSSLQQEREKAGRAIERIAKELKRRKIST